jgi:dihydrofolate reductase
MLNKAKYSMIAAVSENNVIGKDGQLPWHIPEDLQRFKKLTTGHTLVMGRKTYDAIGRPLPDRRTIVLSKDKDLKIEGSTVAHSVEEVLELTKEEKEVFIAGGAEIYEQFMPYVSKIYLTIVHSDFEGDTYFPMIPVDFIETESEEVISDIPFTYKVLEKKN